MANLSTKKWVRYEPSIPGNAALPESERFYLEVCAGLSVAELDELREAVPAVFRKRADLAGAEAVRIETVMARDPESGEMTPVPAGSTRLEVFEAGFGDALARALDGAVRMGAEPLTDEGVPVKTLGEYLAIVGNQAGIPLVRELMACINHHNSWEGLRVLFSVRPFGGTTGTASEKTGPAESQTVAR